MRPPHFDRVVMEIERVLTARDGLQSGDKKKVQDALNFFRKLQLEYHGAEDSEEEEA